MTAIKIQSTPHIHIPVIQGKPNEHPEKTHQEGTHYRDVLNLEQKENKIPNRENSVRFFFFSDVHSRPEKMDNFIKIANTEQPDLNNSLQITEIFYSILLIYTWSFFKCE